MTTTRTATPPQLTDSADVPPAVVRRTRLIWPLLLVGALTAYTGLLIRGSYFFDDDFISFGFAHRLGFGWSLITVNIFGHVAPTERMLHYVPLAISPLNFAVAEVIILLLYAFLMLAFLWNLRELRVHPIVELTLLFVVGTSVVMLNETYYYDQTVFLLPASTFILCVTALFLHWSRTGRLWALCSAWVVFALSFVTQERPIVIPVYLVLFRYLVLPYRRAPGGKKKWLSDWRIWLPFALIAGAYVVYYESVAPNSSTSLSVVFDFLGSAAENFVRTSLGLAGTGAPWATLAALVSVAAAVIAAIALPRRRRLVLRALAFFVVVFLVNLVPVVHGIGGLTGAGAADDIQYYIDALFALGLAVGVACSDWLLREGRDAVARRTPRHAQSPSGSSNRWVIAVCIAVVVVHVILLPFGIMSENRHYANIRVGRAWMTNALASLRVIGAAHSGTVIPLTIPASFDAGFESPYNLEASVFPFLRGWRIFDTGPVGVTGGTGAIEPVSAGDSVTLTANDLRYAIMNNVHRVSGPPDAACFAGDSKQGQISWILPHPVAGGVVAGDMTVQSDRPFDLTPFAASHTKVSVAALPTTAAGGTHRVVAAFPPLTASAFSTTPVTNLGFVYVSPHSHFCITSLQVGSVRAHVGRQCQEIDIYGSPNEVASCGVPWQGKKPPAPTLRGA